jgi:signal recognition particle receptor subunit beta
MVFFNWATMQMAAKIVYYGPGLCGKTSNLSFIYAKTAPNSRGEMVSLETESDRTLFFDLLPIEVGTIGGFKTRLQLYTVPGQVFYNTTRKLVLKGVDGLVFVADSQRPMREANIESFESLIDNLRELDIDVSELPLVLQYNKRDLKNILAIEELNSDLNPERAYPFFESEAINGVGVFETLKEITKVTLKNLRKRMVAPHAASPSPRAAGPQVRPTSAGTAKPVTAQALARAAADAVGPNAAAEPPRTATSAPPLEPPPVLDDSAFDEPSTESPFAEDSPGAQASAPEEIPLDDEFELDDEGAGASPMVDAGEDSPFDELEVDDQPAAAAGVAEAEELDVDDVESESVAGIEEESDVEVEFDQANGDTARVEPPPVKRVQVSNQMDILAELEGLRKQATMGSFNRQGADSAGDLDIDALLAGTDESRELRRKIEQSLNSDVFRHMGALQLAIRIQNAEGETIHTLEPVSLAVDKADNLRKLSLQLTVDLENKQ